jgi:surfactin synthase thioesterase subunit
MMNALLITVTAGLLGFASGAQGAFEVTPLDTAESRSNAAAFWAANGCAPFGVLAMVRAMEHYYAQPPEPDAARAPLPIAARRYASSKD